MVAIIILTMICAIILVCFTTCIYNHLVESYKEQIDWLQDDISNYQDIIQNYQNVIEKQKEGVKE